MSNVFLVREGSLQKPLFDRRGVAGVMRAVALDTARTAVRLEAWDA
jgi:branched-subunit amino acid aminotransferase/4-amino-4-deoxychorismate lyase